MNYKVKIKYFSDKIYTDTDIQTILHEVSIFTDLSNIKDMIIFKGKIGRIIDIQVHPNNGKIYFLAGDSLWLMEKN